jgi:hypothetical protein
MLPHLLRMNSTYISKLENEHIPSARKNIVDLINKKT